MSSNRTSRAEKAGTAKTGGISNPDKVFWQNEGYTKSDLAEFYRGIFPLLRPYVQDRILTLERCPDGLEGQCFYQKEKPDSMPTGTPTKRLANATGKRKWTNYVVGGSLETQLALVNLGCIPVHVTGSRARTFPKPDWVCFDLDPASGKFRDAAEAGNLLKVMLADIGLKSFPKTSGSRGLHVFVPIRLGPTADEVLKFAEEVVSRLAAKHPKLLTTEHSISARGKRVYLDPFRNGSVQTVVSPYSVRRKPRAPVSTPLDWTEVKSDLDPSDFNLGNFEKRRNRKDPWAKFFSERQTLKTAMAGLQRM
jgi:bifunctional non-homologous end joining protein LigD